MCLQISPDVRRYDFAAVQEFKGVYPCARRNVHAEQCPLQLEVTTNETERGEERWRLSIPSKCQAAKTVAAIVLPCYECLGARFRATPTGRNDRSWRGVGRPIPNACMIIPPCVFCRGWIIKTQE